MPHHPSLVTMIWIWTYLFLSLWTCSPACAPSSCCGKNCIHSLLRTPSLAWGGAGVGYLYLRPDSCLYRWHRRTCRSCQRDPLLWPLGVQEQHQVHWVSPSCLCHPGSPVRQWPGPLPPDFIIDLTDFSFMSSIRSSRSALI